MDLKGQECVGKIVLDGGKHWGRRYSADLDCWGNRKLVAILVFANLSVTMTSAGWRIFYILVLSTGLQWPWEMDVKLVWVRVKDERLCVRGTGAGCGRWLAEATSEGNHWKGRVGSVYNFNCSFNFFFSAVFLQFSTLDFVFSAICKVTVCTKLTSNKVIFHNHLLCQSNSIKLHIWPAASILSLLILRRSLTKASSPLSYL